MARVTVVNDDPEFLAVLAEVLEGEGHETTTLDGSQQDLAGDIRASRPEVVIVDLRMGADDLRGWHAARAVRDAPGLEGVPILLCSADIQALAAVEDELAQDQAVESLAKPFGIEALTDAIDRLVARSAGR